MTSQAELDLEAFRKACELHTAGHTVSIVSTDNNGIMDCKTLSGRDEVIEELKIRPRGGRIWLCIDESGDVSEYPEQYDQPAGKSG